MKKALSVILILSALALCGCSDGGKDTELRDEPELSETKDEGAVSQTTTVETTEETEEEPNPPLPEIEYVYLDDADLSHMYTDEELGVHHGPGVPGVDSVILYETQWNDLTIQLTGHFVHKRANSSENILFANNVQVRAINGEGNEIGKWRVEQNYSRHRSQWFYCEVDTASLEDFLRVYTMIQNGREYPLIVAMQKVLEEDDYDTTFFTVTEGELTGFYGVTDDEELQELITTYDKGRIGGVVLSGDFLIDGESCTLVDKNLEVKFSFDFDNAEVTAELTETYVYLDDIQGDIPVLSNEARNEIINGGNGLFLSDFGCVDNVIIYEAKWQDYIFQLAANSVHKREDASENTLFMDAPYCRVLDGEGRFLSEDGAHINIRHAQGGAPYYYFDIDASKPEFYMQVYTMTQNGRDYPLIVTLVSRETEGETDYDATFHTLDPDDRFIYFSTHQDDEITEMLGWGGSVGIGMLLSGDFTCDGDNCTLTDNKLGVSFSFDFADTAFDNIKVTAELIN